MCVLRHFSPVQLFVTQWTVARQAPLSMGLFRQEHWSGDAILLLLLLGWVLTAACWLSLAEVKVSSWCRAQALECTASVVAVRRLSCPMPCGILVPRKREKSNPLSLLWEADSQPLDHQRSPCKCIYLPPCSIWSSFCWLKRTFHLIIPFFLSTTILKTTEQLF